MNLSKYGTKSNKVEGCGWLVVVLVGWLVRYGSLSFTVSFKLSVFFVAAAVF